MRQLQYISIISLMAAQLSAITPATAQTAAADSLMSGVTLGITQSGKAAGLNMTLNPSAARLSHTERLILRPVLCGQQDTACFTPIVLNSRKAAITYARNLHSEGVPGAMVIDAHHTQGSVDYRGRIPFEDWMTQARLYVVEDRCGCGITDAGALQGLQPVGEICKRQASELQVEFAAPEAEAVKERAESGSAYIDFPVNQTVIDPNYHSNQAELQKIVGTIDVMRADNHIQLERVTIHGYASPEGKYDANARLAECRAEALTAYVASLSNVDRSKFITRSTPEDWDGLKVYLQKSQVSHSREILELIDSEADPDRRDYLIRLRYPDTYASLLSDVYPRLRHSDYTVNYQVRAFTVDEARQYLETHPSYLSLDEIFKVAQASQTPEERYRVMQKAVTLFPDSELANLDAACAAIQCNDLTGAARYLPQAGDSPQALNARGVVAALQGDYATALQQLQRVDTSQCPQAAHNLEVVDILAHNRAQQQIAD